LGNVDTPAKVLGEECSSCELRRREKKLLNAHTSYRRPGKNHSKGRELLCYCGNCARNDGGLRGKVSRMISRAKESLLAHQDKGGQSLLRGSRKASLISNYLGVYRERVILHLFSQGIIKVRRAGIARL